MIELLSERLRNLRVGKKLSQKQVAALIGVDPSTISTYENATRLPSYSSLIKLAKVYGVTIDYLLGMEDKHSTDLLSRLSGDDREIIIRIAEIIIRYRGKSD